MNVRLPPLPYAVDALEPHLSRRTLAEHHGKRHRAHIDRTRQLIENTWHEYAPLQAIVRETAAAKERALFSAAAQAWNHSFYWSSMDPAGGGEADGQLAELIESSFGTQSALRRGFVAAAREHTGPGWVWLVLDGEQLRIVTTAEEDTALILDVSPLITIDICEHAYHADYQERRDDYINSFVAHLANWKFASRNMAAAFSRQRRSASIMGTRMRTDSKEMPAPSRGGSWQPPARALKPLPL